MAMRRTVSLAALMLAWGMYPALADEAAAQKWVDSEFQPSTLSKDEQMKEMKWFIEAVPGHGDQRAVGRHPDAPL